MKPASSISLLGLLALAGALTTPAWSFDTGAHFSLTRDALAAEGFGNTAIQVAQAANTLTDYYCNAASNPYSGEAGFLKTFLTGLLGLTLIDNEHWSPEVTQAAWWLHFDYTPFYVVDGKKHFLDSPRLLAMEWDRLEHATRGAVLGRAQARDPMGMLVAMGISLHCVQDFYAHTSWVEPSGKPGYDGPGWAQKGDFGSNPTWFDVPPAVRDAADVYSCAPGLKPATSDPHARVHGDWKSDGNKDLATAMNKDWPGRPCYREAYMSAYFATRQWVRALRRWVNNPDLWSAAQNYSDRHGDQLDRDVHGMTNMSFYAGHWQGQGEPTGAEAPGPGGSLLELPGAVTAYQKPGRTVFRTKFEQMVVEVASKTPPAGDVPVASSRDMQAATSFVGLEVTHVRDATGTLEVGIDPGPDQADFYTRANIAGQDFMSGAINGHDNYRFPLPNYPFLFLKAVPTDFEIDEPVTTLQVEIHTADARNAGTDDDVYLHINDRTRFALDKPTYNDFERNDTDTYCINPPAGLRVRDIAYLQIEKSRDGFAGGWKLGGVTLKVNGAVAYQNKAIDKWIENGHLTWRAPDFHPKSPTTRDVPVSLALWDSDGGLYGKDDHCDINPNYGLRNLRMLVNPGDGEFRGDASGTGKATSLGGSANGGRGSDKDECEIAFAFEHFTPTPPP